MQGFFYAQILKTFSNISVFLSFFLQTVANNKTRSADVIAELFYYLTVRTV